MSDQGEKGIGLSGNPGFSREVYRDILASMDEGFCILQMIFDDQDRCLDYLYLEANEAFERQTGLKDVVGKTIRMLVPDLDESWFRRYGNVALTGQPIRFENYAPAMGRWFDVYASPLGAREDRRIFLVFKDTTAFKRNADALEASERELHKFALLVEAGNDLIAIADKEGRMTFLNAEGRRLVGHDPAVDGRPMLDMVSEEDAVSFRKVVAAAWAGSPWQGELRLRLAGSGSGFPAACNLFTLRSQESSEPLALAMVARDLTLEREKEEQLRQAQRVEAIGHLAGGVAHDFNNILTAINGYSEMLLGSMPADDPRREYLLEIHRSGLRAASLTSQLLAYSRKQVMQPKVLQLNAIVQESLRLLQRLLGEAIEFKVDLDPGLLSVKADPNKMQQILLNLCLNARDAMPGGGRLIVATRNLEASTLGGSKPESPIPWPCVALEVRDTGVGMSPELQARIFEPFFTTKEVGKGTGLGLSSVEGIVKQSGGAIHVNSQAGKGSTFTVYLPGLPHETEPAEEEVLDGEILPSHRAGSVLLVEDEETVRKFVRILLENQGFSVLEACNGVEALDLLDAPEIRPDLILSDVIMPKMGGPELAAAVRARFPHLPILFMSGYTREALDDRFGMEPPIQVLQKPFNPSVLYARIVELLALRPHG